jgi:hypothetical protein
MEDLTRGMSNHFLMLLVSRLALESKRSLSSFPRPHQERTQMKRPLEDIEEEDGELDGKLHLNAVEYV